MDAHHEVNPLLPGPTTDALGQPIPAVERDVALDMVRRGLLVAPVIVFVAWLVSGAAGAAGAGIALAIVFANFLAAALSVSWAARISPGAVGMVALGGVVLRMGFVVLALWALHDVSWISFPWLGLTLVTAHLGLLAWETRYVSMSLAAPGLRPGRPVTPGDQ